MDLFIHSRRRFSNWQDQRRVINLAQQVAVQSNPDPSKPVAVLFNASTRLTGLSLNAAFSMLTGWSLRLTGVRVIHFVCRSGMSHCVLGINRQDYTEPPPCEGCIAQSDRLFSGAEVWDVSYQQNGDLAATIKDLSVEGLSEFDYQAPEWISNNPIPLGKLVLPSVRWTLRRFALPDDEPTRYLLREYILSAYNIVKEFASLLEEYKPHLAIIFNGIMYPEAAARWVARQMGVRSVAHEVGFQPASGFFTEDEPTAYPISIPDDFELSESQNTELNAYLEKRFQGNFTMAGIRFWPEMRGLDETLLKKITQFKQTVPVFTNVVYDTSQVHANVIFPHMFAWLDTILAVVKAHPETLFVFRAHPDEMRPGSAKQSRESVRDWMVDNRLSNLSNVVFIDSQEYVSSYELIQRSKFVIVYNSSIGLEASLMGKAVVCGGKARYTQYPTVFFPQSAAAFRQQVEEFLEADEIGIPVDFQRNARRFLYYQLFRTSLPFGDYLQTGPRMGYVQLKPFSWTELLPEKSITMNVLHDGFVHGKPFLLPEKN